MKSPTIVKVLPLPSYGGTDQLIVRSIKPHHGLPVQLTECPCKVGLWLLSETCLPLPLKSVHSLTDAPLLRVVLFCPSILLHPATAPVRPSLRVMAFRCHHHRPAYRVGGGPTGAFAIEGLSFSGKIGHNRVVQGFRGRERERQLLSCLGEAGVVRMVRDQRDDTGERRLGLRCRH